MGVCEWGEGMIIFPAPRNSRNLPASPRPAPRQIAPLAMLPALGSSGHRVQRRRASPTGHWAFAGKREGEELMGRQGSRVGGKEDGGN